MSFAMVCGAHPVVVVRQASSALDLLAAELSEEAVDAATTPIVILQRPVSPHSASGDWPTPRGNLYLAWFEPKPDPLLDVEERIVAWFAELQPPIIAIALGEPGAYGGVKVDVRFVAGVAVMPHPAGALVGADLHIGASPRAYRRLGEEARHVSAVGLGARRPGVAEGWAAVARLAGLPPDACASGPVGHALP